jgi:hypothetical protein
MSTANAARTAIVPTRILPQIPQGVPVDHPRFIETLNSQLAVLAGQVNDATAASTSSTVSASGEQLVITVPGTLAIQSNAGQLPAFFNAKKRLTGAMLQLGTAAIGASVVVQVTTAAGALFTLVLAAAASVVSASSSQIVGAPTIAAGTQVVINITSVGSSFPGANATLMLW